YRIESELGRGGMGVVYRAHDTLLDRAVAVKVLSDSGLGTEGRARLLREAQAAAKLDHPNIVSVYYAGEADPAPSGGTGGTPFIVMQLVGGTSLRDIGPLSVAQIITVARQLCDALDHAHAQGIIHRDLKPENVVVVGSGERLIAKLMDFGLALSPSASRLTQEGALVGTVFYLAPEQALGQPVDGRADLYALGVVLYELTTGRLPFTGDDPLVVISQHLHAPVTPPRAHNPAISPELESLILQLLSKQPEDRPASAREALQALTTPQAQLPGGNITFLFTDIEGSTPLWERDPNGMQESLARHDAILHEAVEAHGGQVFKVIGDAFQVAFVNPMQAVMAALAAQRALAATTWGATGPLRVRMGLHAGPAEARGGDYAASHTLNRVARVASAGHGGQILLSLAVAEQVSDGISLRDLGKHRLKGLSQAEHLFQIVADDLPSDFPPLNSTPVTPPTGGEVSSLLDRIVRGRLVGREAELTETTTLWQRVVAGEGQVLLVSGEPGVGKTRLVRELMTQAQASGAIVLVGECYAEGGAPYAPIGQIIRQALDTPGWEYPAGSRLGLPDFVVADLITLAPGLRARYPDIPLNPPLDPQSEQEHLHESVIELCARLTQVARAPLLLFVDDVHWADSGTLFLLRHLARRLRRGRAMIVATYREVELDEARPLHEVLLDLNRERLAARLKLSRLSREQTRDLLTAMFAEETTPEFLEGIYHETEGNPFFVEEVCKALVESGQLYFADGRWRRPPDMADMEIPQSVRVAIQSRVNKLPAPAQESLLLAAIIGREFDFETLLAASDPSTGSGQAPSTSSGQGPDEDKLIEILETAERAQLIEELRGKSGEVYTFVHAL
ncbi:MAG: AAA family ATPase, partial [Chloroflexota bacterium]